MAPDLKNIVWIASYPKSGNTWLRFLACNLVFGPVDSAAALNQLAPDLHESRIDVAPTGRRLLIKTHFPFSTALPWAQQTAGAIYIVREPADVLLSNFHYAQRSGAAATEIVAQFERYFEAFLATRGDLRWVKLGMGSLEENVRSWVGIPRKFPVLRIRYEDLLSDGLRVTAELARFLGIERTAAQLAEALAGASFERMRAIEEADIAARRVGIFYKPYLEAPICAGLRFMRAGKSGEGTRAFTVEQQQRFDAAFASLRGELGYAGR